MVTGIFLSLAPRSGDIFLEVARVLARVEETDTAAAAAARECCTLALRFTPQNADAWLCAQALSSTDLGIALRSVARLRVFHGDAVSLFAASGVGDAASAPANLLVAARETVQAVPAALLYHSSLILPDRSKMM
jgi:Flp pilus assembly protein CpaB